MKQKQTLQGNNPHDTFARKMMGVIENATVDLVRFIPHFDYIVVDLSTIPENHIESKLFTRPKVKAWLLVQKYIFYPKQLLSRLKKIIQMGILNEREEGERTFLQIVFRYILSASEIEQKDIAEVLQNSGPIVEEELMTGAEKLIQEGVEKGTLLDKQEVLIKQLSRKFGLTEEEKTFIKSINDREKLDHAIDEFVFAETKKQVLDKLRK